MRRYYRSSAAIYLGVLVAGGLLASGIDSGFAQDEGTEAKADITVKARHLDRNLFERPSMEAAGLGIATSEIGTNDMARQNPGTVTEALEYSAPGIFTETRGRKIKQFTSFRGQRYPYPDYAIGGVWQDEFHDAPYFFPASQVEKIEVVRSSAALMMGLSEPVGVINIIPKRFGEPGSYVEGEYGTYDTYRLYGSYEDVFRDGGYKVGINQYGTAGPDDLNAAEEMTSFSLLTDWQKRRLSVEGSLFWIYGMREIRRAEAPARGRLQNTEERFDPYNTGIFGLKAHYTHDPDRATELKLNYATRLHEFVNPGAGPSDHEDEDYEYSADLIHVFSPWADNILRVGGTYHHWVAPDGKRMYAGSEMDVHTLSAVVVDEHHFDRLIIDGGVRYSKPYFSTYGGYTFDTEGNRFGLSEPIEDEWDDPVLRTTAGAKYEVTSEIDAYMHAGVDTVQPAPGAVTSGFDEPDNEIRTTVDAGVEASNPGIGRIKVGGFYALRKDAISISGQIATNALGEEFDLYENTDLVQYGFEMEGQTAKIAKYYSLFLNATVMESLTKADGDWDSFRDLPDVIVSSGVYMDVDRLDCNLFGKYVSDYENRRFATGGTYEPLGDFVELNLTAGYKLGAERNTRVYGSVKNITDEEYSTVVGYPDYGRRYALGVQHYF